MYRKWEIKKLPICYKSHIRDRCCKRAQAGNTMTHISNNCESCMQIYPCNFPYEIK
uniref:Uncharacterized protein n=1 Tax=Anguilla anguilla TaxID=7936 RepID=A0A0E9PBL0_ANGAN